MQPVPTPHILEPQLWTPTQALGAGSRAMSHHSAHSTGTTLAGNTQKARSGLFGHTLKCAMLVTRLQDRLNPLPSKPTKDASPAARPSQYPTRAEKLSSRMEMLVDNFSGDESKVSKTLVRGLLQKCDNLIQDLQEASNLENLSEHETPLLTILVDFRPILQSQKHTSTRNIARVVDLIAEFERVCELELSRWCSGHDTTRQRTLYVDILKQWISEVNRYGAPPKAAPGQGHASVIPSRPYPESHSPPTGRPFGQAPSQRHPSPFQPSDGRLSPQPHQEIEIDQLLKSPLLVAVMELFHIDYRQLRAEAASMLNECTIEALLRDLILLRDVMFQGHSQSLPVQPSEFATEDAYRRWRIREQEQLDEKIAEIRAALGNGTVYSSPSHDAHWVSQTQTALSSFGFIPRSSAALYRQLVQLSMQYNTAHAQDPLRSPPHHTQLLTETFVLWRVSPIYRAVSALDVQLAAYQSNSTYSISLVQEACVKFMKAAAIRQIPKSDWTRRDQAYAAQVMQLVGYLGFKYLKTYLKDYETANIAEIGTASRVLEGAMEVLNTWNVDMNATTQQWADEITTVVEAAAVSNWQHICNQAQTGYGSVGSERTLYILDYMTQQVDILHTRLAHVIVWYIHIPSVILGKQLSFFALEMENWAHDVMTTQEAITFTEIVRMYRACCDIRAKLREMMENGQSNTLQLDVESWFFKSVESVLQATQRQLADWVHNALAEDKFLPISKYDSYSSSVTDVFEALEQSLGAFRDLRWEAYEQGAAFALWIAKIVALTIESYCLGIEERVRATFDRQKKNSSATDATQSGPKTANWYNKAKSQFRRSADVFMDSIGLAPFTREDCIKLNDIDAMRKRLDNVFESMDIEAITQILHDADSVSYPPTMAENDMNTVLFSVHFSQALDLQSPIPGTICDPFVVLEHNGEIIARSHVLYETLNPIWDTTVSVRLPSTETVCSIKVIHQDLLGDDKVCGTQTITFNSAHYENYQTRGYWLDLTPAGKIHIGISMEGEANDIQFWFGKAYRSLKRTEENIADLFVSKLSGIIKHQLSMKMLDKVTRRDHSLSSRFLGGSESEKPPLTTFECEEILYPLLDCLEPAMQSLNDYLFGSKAQLVLLKIWSTILSSLKDLLIPDVGDQLAKRKPLDEDQFLVVYKWLELLKTLFNGGADGDALPVQLLENAQYLELLSINLAYFDDAQSLMRTFLDQKAEQERKPRIWDAATMQMTTFAYGPPKPDTILCILRLRSGKDVKDFLHHQIHGPGDAKRKSENRLSVPSIESLRIGSPTRFNPFTRSPSPEGSRSM